MSASFRSIAMPFASGGGKTGRVGVGRTAAMVDKNASTFAINV